MSLEDSGAVWLKRERRASREEPLQYYDSVEDSGFSHFEPARKKRYLSTEINGIVIGQIHKACISPLKPKLVYMMLKDLVRTAKKTPHFTVTKTDRLTLFK
jgi:hypothetical protein